MHIKVCGLSYSRLLNNSIWLSLRTWWTRSELRKKKKIRGKQTYYDPYVVYFVAIKYNSSNASDILRSFNIFIFGNFVVIPSYDRQ